MTRLCIAADHGRFDLKAHLVALLKARWASMIVHLAILHQGKIESILRIKNMIAQMDLEGFGACSNTEACTAICPKLISHQTIVRLNCEYLL